MTKKIDTLADLTPDGENFNRHTEFGQKLLEESLRKFGAGRSILVDKDGNIIAGNSTTETAAAIGMDDVIVVPTDGKKLVVVQRTDLSLDSPEGRELALADNMTALKGIDIDLEKVQETLGDDLAKAWGMELPKVAPEAKEDDFDPDAPVETVCQAGDIWKLGNHRLMCGDSTDAGSVALLMDGEKADLCLTDPPYKIESGGGGESEIAKSLTVQKSDIDFISGFDPTDFLKILPTVFDKNMNAYVFCNKDLLPQYLNWAVENGYGFNVLIWKKPSAIPIKDAHRPDIEYLLFFRKKAIWNHSLEGVNYSRCLEYSRVQRSEENGNHPTPKPIALIGNELQISSNKGSIVLDLFGGTGSTLIAAEQLNRKCYMMELDPHYCDVIIARWEKLTNQKAERISNGN